MKARPTILGAMGVVAFVSVGMAAIRTNGFLLALVLLAMTVFTLCTTTIVAMDRGGAWAGFAVFGWAQFLICQPHAAPTPGPTTLAMRGVYEVLCDISMPTSVPLFFSDTGRAQFPRAYSLDGNWALVDHGPRMPGQRSGIIPLQSLRAALCLLSLIVGSAGALVGGFVSRRDETRVGAQNRQGGVA